MINKFLRNLGLKKRLVIGFCVIPIMLICIIFILFYNTGTYAIKSKVNGYSEEFVKLIEKNISLNVNKFEEQLDEIMLNHTIDYGLTNNKIMSTTEKREFIDNLDNFIYSKLHFLSNLGEVELLSKDLNIIYTQGFKYFNKDDIIKYSRIASEKVGKTIWFHTQISDEGVIGIARAIKQSQSDSINGYIFVALDEGAFSNIFSNSNLGEDNTIFILNKDNEYLFGQKDIEYRKKIDVDSKNIILDSKSYLINVKRISGLDWKVINLISYNYMLKEFRELGVKLAIYTIIFLIIILIIATCIYKSIYDPIHKLMISMNSVINGDFNVGINDNGKDEINILSTNFDNLVRRISGLLAEVKEIQNSKREAEINMLQAQINPHFLFNTLNTLKWIATMNEDISVSKGLSSLAKLLRNTIVDKSELIMVEEELENIKNYIVIQKLRYGDVFDIEYNFNENVKRCKIIKFLLQPIVENSILHGFDENDSGQVINIDLSIDENELIILISDNGKGFDTNAQKECGYRKLSGIGIVNIDERIKLTFGEGFGLQIKSEVDVGTEVRINLPII